MIKRILRRLVNSTSGWLNAGLSDEPLFCSALYSWTNTNYLALLQDEKCNTAVSWGILQSAATAKRLGVSRISMIEFGVAGGNGLISMEYIIKKVEALVGIEIALFGFDTGTGLPAIEDYKDKPHVHEAGDFPMDVDKLQARLTKARLIIGDIKDTLAGFVKSKPDPVAFIVFDVDMYSSTVSALQLLEASESVLMQRVFCFFDDYLACGDFDGERLAVTEFNESHPMRKISPIHGRSHMVPERLSRRACWHKYQMAYIFDHSKYAVNQELVQHDWVVLK